MRSKESTDGKKVTGLKHILGRSSRRTDYVFQMTLSDLKQIYSSDPIYLQAIHMTLSNIKSDRRNYI